MVDPILASIDYVVKEIENDEYSREYELNLLTRIDIENNLIAMVKSMVLFA